MYQAKLPRVEAYQVRKDGMCPQWLIEYINAGTVYWQGGADPHYTIVIPRGELRAFPNDWIVYTNPLKVYTPEDFAEQFEEVKL